MKVLKFGGSSVASSQSIQQILEIVKQTSKSEKTIVVVSAFGKTTDKLLKAAHNAVHNLAYNSLLQEVENHHLQVLKN
jgi:aspartokinase/homoserine dehydrogenase 1